MIDSGCAPFPSTHWTMIFDARCDPAALEELLGRYWRPVFAYLRRRGHDAADAADITQSFMTEVMLERKLVHQVEREGGRFRSYLMTALRRFEIDEFRRRRRDPAASAVGIPGGGDALTTGEPAPDRRPEEAFDHLWAATVLNATIDRMKASMQARDQMAAWRAFEARVLNPAVHGGRPPTLEDVGREIDIDDPARLSKMLHAARRRFGAALREVVAQTVAPNEVDDEVSHLFRCLGISMRMAAVREPDSS